MILTTLMMLNDMDSIIILNTNRKNRHIMRGVIGLMKCNNDVDMMMGVVDVSRLWQNQGTPAIVEIIMVAIGRVVAEMLRMVDEEMGLEEESERGRRQDHRGHVHGHGRRGRECDPGLHPSRGRDRGQCLGMLIGGGGGRHRRRHNDVRDKGLDRGPARGLLNGGDETERMEQRGVIGKQIDMCIGIVKREMVTASMMMAVATLINIDVETVRERVLEMQK